MKRHEIPPRNTLTIYPAHCTPTSSHHENGLISRDVTAGPRSPRAFYERGTSVAKTSRERGNRGNAIRAQSKANRKTCANPADAALCVVPIADRDDSISGGVNAVGHRPASK